MHASPDRIGLLRKKISVRLRESFSKGLEILKPFLSVDIVPGVKLLSQLQSPGPSVGAFKRLAVGLLHICNLGLDVLWREVRVERIAYLSRLREIWKCLQQPREHPVTMHG